MTAYWLLFSLPGLAVLQPLKMNARVQGLFFSAFAIAAVLMIGLRHEIGGDWDTYLDYFERSRGSEFLEALSLQDPGYMAINWLAANLGLGIAGVNLFCGAVLVGGLLRFCTQQPFPWLGLVVATPYLLIVVGMGYSRQAVALGFVLWALSIWSRGSFLRFSALVFLASLFHHSAVFVLPFGLLARSQHPVAKWLIGAPVLALFASALVLTGDFETRLRVYLLEPLVHSEGGLIRATMNAIPSGIFFLFRRHFARYDDYILWKLIAAICLLSLPATQMVSTLVDRLLLYLSPIQIAVFCRLPTTVADRSWRTLIVLAIILSYAAVLFVWLNFAIHSEYWVPYRWILFP